MKIEIKTQEASVHYVSLKGDLDFNSAKKVREELAKLLQKDAPKVLMDLGGVRYIDSSGLATFIDFFQKMKRSSGKLAFFNVNQSVRSVFEIAKLDTVFHLMASEQEALAQVS